MRTFEGKVALVTGGSSGIGAATAIALARGGAKVVLAADRPEGSDAVLNAIAAFGGEAIFVRSDVALDNEVEAMVEATIERFGRLDCAVNGAGITGDVKIPTAEIERANWDRVIGINLTGVWLCMKHQIPVMLAQGAGAIVNVSSIYGLKPSDAGHAAYCASKFGVIGLSKTAAVDYGQRGLRINVVAPGFTVSGIVDPNAEGATEKYRTMTAKYSAMNRLGDPRETAAAIAWLCSDAASFVNGAVLTVDGGDTTPVY
ncbi:glucose 1-dehydrogenase [Thiocapsa bogorovii]|uniref:glucose 1-dehydrogenase n=1 Tax=Thiocapsa bogorovii TaxID=521689 RepID=UPI001E530491|nr:glucose 1-dehydrogenase [Thiocapsa bogorovii]UHD16727.1 glucose 1-dehydrogenase [Thiocapsa bogorovii]